MNKGINLISRKEGSKREVRKFVLVSIGIFAVVFVITASIVVVNYILNNQYGNLLTQETDLKSQISTLSSKRELIYKLHDRLGSANKIITTRKDVEKRLVDFSALASSDVTLRSINGVDNKLKLTFESEDLSELRNLVDIIYELDVRKELIETKKGVKKIQLTGFQRGESSYQATYEIDFASKTEN